MNQSKTKSTHKIIFQGKKPIDVAIKMKIDNVESIKYWNEYLYLTENMN